MIRLIPGARAALFPYEVDAMFRCRARVFGERLGWESKPEYHGELVDFGPMMTWPKPVQKPHPPIIVGGAFPHAARRAVRYGNGWVPIAGRAPHGDVNDFLPKFKQMAAEAGRAPDSLPITLVRRHRGR